MTRLRSMEMRPVQADTDTTAIISTALICTNIFCAILVTPGPLHSPQD